MLSASRGSSASAIYSDTASPKSSKSSDELSVSSSRRQSIRHVASGLSKVGSFKRVSRGAGSASSNASEELSDPISVASKEEVPATVKSHSSNQRESLSVATANAGSSGASSTNKFQRAVKPVNKSHSYTHQTSRKTAKIPPIVRFQKAAEAILKFIKASKAFNVFGPFKPIPKDEDDEEMEMSKKQTGFTYGGIVFDVDYYKVNRNDILTETAKEIFKKPKEARSSYDLDLVLGFVQKIKAFERHSLTMKKELSKILIYETFGKNRNIVKQGHRADNFYYIVRGEVIVTREDKDEDTNTVNTRVLAELKAGDSFGEVALTKNVARNATITTLKRCEFLKVERDDFQNLLQSTFEKSVNMRMNLLQRIKIFQALGRSKIETIASLCRASEFPAHSTILEEGKASEDIYFISRGKCKLIKKIFLLGKKLEGGSWKYRIPNQLDRIPTLELRKGEHVVAKVLHIVDLRSGDFFGEDFMLNMSRRQAMNEVIQNSSKSYWSIIAETKLECLIVSKIDLIRTLTQEEFNLITAEYASFPPLIDMIRSYVKKLEWSAYKKEYMDEIEKIKCSNKLSK